MFVAERAGRVVVAGGHWTAFVLVEVHVRRLAATFGHRHDGVRRRGSRRGSSSDLAAHSRNRAANNAEPLTSAASGT